MVTIGIDTHKATLAVSAIDPTGRETGARTFPNDRQGHVGILRWAQARGAERRFGIEGFGQRRFLGEHGRDRRLAQRPPHHFIGQHVDVLLLVAVGIDAAILAGDADQRLCAAGR